MDAIAKPAEPVGLKEVDRQFELLDWARTRIDGIANHGAPADRIDALIEVLAHFCRDYFGYQERLLGNSTVHLVELAERKVTHAEFQQRLAHLYTNAIGGDPNLPRLLNALCHELWLDVQTRRDEFAALAERPDTTPPPRGKVRTDSAALRAILRFNS
jgi:hypothetical protein